MSKSNWLKKLISGTASKAIALSLALVLAVPGQSVSYAAESVPKENTVEAEDKTTNTESKEQVYDDETGLLMQTMTLEDDASENSEEYEFDMEAHKAVLKLKDEQNSIIDNKVVDNTYYDDPGYVRMVGNDYIEIAVNDSDYNDGYDYDRGRFTIGTVEGSPNYTTDNNKILMYGHSEPSTSFTTVRINGTDYIFNATNTTVDTTNKKIISTMTVSGVKVTQVLQIVRNDATSLADTVKISYSAQNMTNSSKTIGIRVMLDTMLGDNDGAPFKVPSRGNVTKEVEFTGNTVPAYWQAFDSLTNPSIYAIGTIVKNNQMRKPDKVQFAAWPTIYETLWDYTVNNNTEVTHDSAVAFYWNPVRVSAGNTTTVETYYGAGLSSTAGDEVDPVLVDIKDKYAVLVTDKDLQPIKNANVNISDFGNQTTDASGIALYNSGSLPAENNPRNKKVTISASGYQTREVYRDVAKNKSVGVSLKADNGKPYVKAINLTGTNNGNFGKQYDLLSENFSVESGDPSLPEYYNVEIIGNGNGKGKVTKFSVIQDNTEICTEMLSASSGTDSKTIRLLSEKLKAGKKLYIRLETDQGVRSDKIETTFLVNKYSNGMFSPDDTTDTTNKGSFKMGFSGASVKIPSDVVGFGGLELNADWPGRDLYFDISQEGKVKVAIGFKPLENGEQDTWENREKKWDEIISKYERGDDIQKVFNNYCGTTKWNVVSKFKPEFKLLGYGEGKLNSETNTCDVNIGVIVSVKGEYTWQQQYIVGYIPLGVEFKASAELTGEVGGGVQISKNTQGKLVLETQLSQGSITLNIGASIYGGLGLIGVLTVGGKGSANLITKYDFLNSYYNVKAVGKISLTAKAFMFSAEYKLAEKEWPITDGYIKSNKTTKNNVSNVNSTESDDSLMVSEVAYKEIYDTFYDSDSYKTMSTSYIKATPDREENVIVKNVYPAAEPKLIMAGSTPYMIWTADIAGRSDYNRTCIVYSKYVGGEWTGPVAIDDNGTADFGFDAAVSGDKIHIVWQDMSKVFEGSEWNSKSDAEKLEEMSSCSDITYAAIDTANNDAVITTKVTGDSYADMLPQITISGAKPYVSWYVNQGNDILKQTGTNEIKIAEIAYGTDVNATGASAIDKDKKAKITEETEETTKEETTKEEATEEETTESEAELETEEKITAKEIDSDKAEVAEAEIESEETTEEETTEEETTEEKTTESETEEVTVEVVDNALTNEKRFTGTITTVKTLNDVSIVDLAIGNWNGKLCVGYILDTDKDEETTTDHEVYVWIKDSADEIFSTNDQITQQNIVFANGKLYWYADGQFFAMSGKDDTPTGLIGEGTDTTATNNYTVLSDGSIIWSATRMIAEDSVVYDIWKMDYSGSKYELPYKLVADMNNPVGKISAAKDSSDVVLSYIVDYGDNVTDIAYVKVSEITDVMLANVDIDPTKVKIGEATPFNIDVTNTGATDITSLTLTIKTENETKVSKNISVNIARGESKTIECSEPLLAGEITGAYEYEFIVTAANETNMGDNSVTKKIGYTDIAVTSAPYYGDGSYFSNVTIKNNTDIPAKNVVIRVFADEEGGAILYEKAIAEVGAYATYALQMDLLKIAGNKSVDDLYIIAYTSNADCCEENNNVYEYLHYIWRDDEKYTLSMRTKKGDNLSEIVDLGEYYPGDIVKVSVDKCKGYDFAGWTSENGYFYETLGTQTYFCMPETDVIIEADFVENAFIKTSRRIAVGESILISPVYDGKWTTVGDTNVAQIKYSGRSVKVVGSGNGTVTLTYKGDNNEETKTVTVEVYTLSSIDVKLDGNTVQDLRLSTSNSSGYELAVVGHAVDGKDIDIPNVNWSIANSKVATVDYDTIRPVNTGKTTLTAQIGSFKTSVDVTVQVPVSSISLSAKGSYVPIGSSLSIKAVVYGVNGKTPTNKKLEWSSSDTSVATVTNGSVKTKNKTGSVYIYAKATDGSGACGTYYVTVTPKVTRMTISKKSYTGYKDSSVKMYSYMSLGVTPSGSVTTSALSWKSSNTKVATVYSGTVYLKGAGTCNITASYCGKSVSMKITCKEYVDGVKITGNAQTQLGKALQLKAAPTNTKATNKNMTWSIDSAYDEEYNTVASSQIASIDAKGKLTPNARGYVYVKATAADGSGKSSTKWIHITAPIKSVQWTGSDSKRNVVPGNSFELSAKVTDTSNNPVNAEITYTSSNAKVATVDSLGLVTAHKKGVANITAAFGGKKATYKVTVVQPVTSIAISGQNTIIEGSSVSLKATVYPSDANNKKIAWKIRDAYDSEGNSVENTDSIARINNGKLTAVKAGKVVLGVEALDGSHASGRFDVDITKTPGKIEVSDTAITLACGNSKEITYNMYDSNNNLMKKSYISWTTSNKKIATITNGIVMGHSKGSAVLKATYGKKTVSVKVTVVQPVEQIEITGNNTVAVKGKLSLKANVLPKTANDKKIEWQIYRAYDTFDDEVSANSIATISASGQISAIKPGTIVVRAIAKDGSNTYEEKTITIYGEPSAITILGNNTVSKGYSTTLSAVVTDTDSNVIENAVVKWSVKDKKVATVDSDGKITGVSTGTTTITATCGKITNTYNIIVQ